jgi:hypothetical protein
MAGKPKKFTKVKKWRESQKMGVSFRSVKVIMLMHTLCEDGFTDPLRGLPDYSRCNIPKREKYTKLPQNIPNVRKI